MLLRFFFVNYMRAMSAPPAWKRLKGWCDRMKNSHLFAKTVFCLIVVLLVQAAPVLAIWPEGGVPLCTDAASQTGPETVSDGAGGAIIVWMDIRDGNYDLYARRVDASGNALWQSDGIPVCTDIYSQYYPMIVSDGSGGAIIAWYDLRNTTDYDIYAQRIDAWGTLMWARDGVAVCTAAESQDYVKLVEDGAGGAILTWEDDRGATVDVYAQRIDASGTALWAAGGVIVSGAASSQYGPEIVTDGAGGAIVTWIDLRNASRDIYAQWIDAAGFVHWTIDGVPVCTNAAYQEDPGITTDGAGGAIVAWYDQRNGVKDIYAQLVDADGDVQWAVNGIPVCITAQDKSYIHMTSDNRGGVVIAWQESRFGNRDIFAQRINNKGGYLWETNGVTVCSHYADQYDPHVIQDGSEATNIVWIDGRSSVTGNDLYAQRLDGYGMPMWPSLGVPVCAEPYTQTDIAVAPDGAGGVITAWAVNISSVFDIYAQQTDHLGRNGYYPPVIHSVVDVPGDEGGFVRVLWDAPPFDPLSGDVTEYTVWRALETPAAPMMETGAGRLTDIEELPAAELRDEITVLRPAPLLGASWYWELVATHPAYRLENYSRIAETYFDSTAACGDPHYFQVIAHTDDPGTYWVSGPDSGYSVDNLAPAAPLGLEGEQFYSPAGLGLSWEPNGEPDLAGYAVYRGTSESFVPGESDLLLKTDGTDYFDGDWSWEQGYWYKVAAVDVHGNESVFAVLGPEMLTGDDPMPLPGATFLAQNFPNPFNPITSIGFGIKEQGHVSLRIYDAAGRLVTTLVDESRPAGNYTTEWNGRDHNGLAVASGIYFYRLKTTEFEETKKMVLLR